jgi:perosamine synthetase
MSFEPGAPTRSGVIPLHVPELTGNERSYVLECLDSGWISSVGPFVERFERMAADQVGRRHAVAVVSGTAALHLALLAAGVKPDDEVIVSALSFVAPANAIRYVGAWPVFIDAEARHWQMDPQKLEQFLARECVVSGGDLHNRSTGRRISALVPVHVLGHPCDVDPIRELAERYGLPLIEDAAEALGATYRGRPVGAFGMTACFSFNGNKLFSTGGGGMVVTDDDTIARRIRYLSTQAKDDPLEYRHDEIGFNYRLPSLQAALGCAQLERVATFVDRKREIARKYSERLGTVPGIQPMGEASWAKATFWLYTVLVDESRYGMNSRALLRHLETLGIQTRPLWMPLPRLVPHLSAPRSSIEVADSLYARALSLPCSVGLSDADLDRVAEAIRNGART